MKILDIIGYFFLVVFTLGWFDLGQGKELTWWNFVAYVGSALG